jgi:hypothetical protein
MFDTDTSLPAPARHDRPGIIPCGIPRAGFITVGGGPRNIEDGQEILFTRTGIRGWRPGSEYTFTHVT